MRVTDAFKVGFSDSQRRTKSDISSFVVFIIAPLIPFLGIFFTRILDWAGQAMLWKERAGQDCAGADRDDRVSVARRGTGGHRPDGIARRRGDVHRFFQDAGG